MSKKLEGKIAVVTGGSAGIGFSTAKRFAAEGARVFITGRRQTQLDQAVKDIGPAAIGVLADASDLADIDRLYSTVKKEAGGVDILVVNAGFYEFGKFGEITEEHFDRTFNTNVRGVLFAVQKSLPLLRSGASVIMTGSIASMKGIPSFSVYDATKAAVRSFARGWIVDLKGKGIRINVLSPGHTDTPGLSSLLSAEQKHSVATTIPLERLGSGEDMAKAAVFLASDESSYITGIELFVDGGVAQF